MAEYLCEEDMSTGEYISRDLALRQLNATCLATDCDNYNGVRCRACAYADAMDFIEAIPAADVQPVKQWVKLHDKHPDTEGFYLVCDQYGECEVAKYIPDIKSWFTHKINGEIRYWMPLPKPPKDGDEE